ncbi:MAG: CAP domain-containing protein [Solirubrobacteraceae bacterium]
MARLRPGGIAVLVAFLLTVWVGAAPALAAHRHKRALHCTKAARAHGKAGSFHAGHSPKHPKRRKAARCPSKHKRAHGHKRASHRTTAKKHSLSSAADNGTCLNAELKPSVTNLELIRGAILCLVNRERANQGESPLTNNAKLEAAAQGHTESMVWNDYFEHLGPGGQTPLDRMRAAGYIYSSNLGFEVGENIAWGTGSLGTPRAVVAAWMGDPGHRANILDARYRDTAIGVSPHVPAAFGHGQSGGIYTQDFGVITGH